MKVRELIALLQEQRQDADVKAYDPDAMDVVPITGITGDAHDVYINTDGDEELVD